MVVGRRRSWLGWVRVRIRCGRRGLGCGCVFGSAWPVRDSARRRTVGQRQRRGGNRELREEPRTGGRGDVTASAEACAGDTTYSLQEEHSGPVVDCGQRRVEDW